METWGLWVFLMTAVAGYINIWQERKQLSIDRRSVWKRAEEVLKLEKEHKIRLAENSQGFDWGSNLPMILSFLGGRGIDTSKVDMNELQGLLQGLEENK